MIALTILLASLRRLDNRADRTFSLSSCGCSADADASAARRSLYYDTPSCHFEFTPYVAMSLLPPAEFHYATIYAEIFVVTFRPFHFVM